MKRRLSAVTTLFPLWALLASVWAYVRPAPWAALQGWIVPLLGLVMFGMGLTLTGADFRRVFQRPGPIVLGMAVNRFLGRRLARFQPAFPLVSVP